MATPKCELIIPFIRSCEKETSEPIEGIMTGKIPEWLQGMLIRNGPGMLRVGEDRFNHIFDGMALIRQFTIKDGRVTYRNRFLRSDTYRKNIEANRIAVSEFGTAASPDPCKTIFERVLSLFSSSDVTDNDLVNIVKFTDEYYALSEANYIWKIDPRNLESLQKVDISKFVPVRTATAHCHVGTDGTVYNIGTDFSMHPNYKIFEVPPKGSSSSETFEKARVICSIPSTRTLNPSYYHSFGMTENFFVFLEQPLHMSYLSLFMTSLTRTDYSSCLQWNPNHKSRFFVVRRNDGTIIPIHYTADPMMVFHHINAFEEDDQLVVDMCCYENGDVVKQLYVEALKKAAENPKYPFIQSQAKRFVLPLTVAGDGQDGVNLVRLPGSTTKAAKQEDGSVFCEPEIIIHPDIFYTELPRINYDFNGRKYRYFYAIARKPSDEDDYLVKGDTKDGTSITWSEPGVIPSEPVFVPAKDSGSEDDGVIVASLLSKTDDKKVALLVLDARTMAEHGRAEFSTESSVPADFHGLFLENN